MEYIVAIIVAIFGSAGFWNWFSNRHASNKDILSAVHGVEERVNTVEDKVESLSRRVEEERAVTARVRILHFCDDCQTGKLHSKESFDQALSDITTYEKHCSANPTFRNNQTEATCRYIKNLYDERLNKHDFA